MPHLNDDNCTGCRACEIVCPVHCISMIENKEGFLYPSIDENQCLHCNLCEKHCHKINTPTLQQFNQIGYGLKIKNNEILNNSASGGAFYALAKYIIEEKKGIVFGASYDESFKVVIKQVDEISDLKILQGSKYVSSDTQDSYLKVRNLLTEGRHVLYTGLPCQIAGLNNYLGRNYENLYTVDIICHGVPSQKLFIKYISYLERKYKRKIINYNFRSKDYGWGSYNAKLTFNDKKSKLITADYDPYYSNFLKSTNCRESCYNCRYAKLERISDITIGDFWGVENETPEFFDKNGVSALLINSTKGNILVNHIKKYTDLVKVDINLIAKHNGQLNSPSKRPRLRDDFYKNIDDLTDIQYMKLISPQKNIKCILKNSLPISLKIKLKKFLKKERRK